MKNKCNCHSHVHAN